MLKWEDGTINEEVRRNTRIRNILKGEVVKKMGATRFEYFSWIKIVMVCGTFRELKEPSGIESNRGL